MASDDYEVGYKKPPLATRFKKGQSGNPQGRPKGTHNLKTDVLEELNEKIVVREGARTIKLSKQRAMVKGLAAKALKGDVRAIRTLVELVLRFDPATIEDEPLELSTDDLEILEAFVTKNQSSQGGQS